MKRLLKLSGFVVLVTLINVATLMVMIGPLMSGAGGGCPVGPGPEARCNGDTNGDGGINIADAIYLLSWLFEEGPPPVAIAGGGLTPEQEEILSHMSIEFLDDGQGGMAKTIRFTRVNVQIVNGLGTTNGLPGDDANPIGITNGVGNLVIGYIFIPKSFPGFDWFSFLNIYSARVWNRPQFV